MSYTASLQASGGTPGYTWSAVNLPSGLSLNSAGVISGTPSTSGSYTSTLTVSDNGTPAQTAAMSAAIVVAPSQLVVGASSLPSGQAGVSYTASLQASGGTPGYTWSAVNLPAGLSLSSAGTIAGTPTASGSYNFSAVVSDKGTPAQTATMSATIVVAPSQLTIGASSLSSGQAGVSYTASLQASGGTPGYTWSLSSGSLPSGLTLSSAGVIAGTPSTSGSYALSLAVSDKGTPAQTATMSATIVVAPSQLAIGASSLPSGQAGVSYTASLQASGGTPGYTWSLSSGSLPAGLSMSSAGTIAGTPTVSGGYNFSAVVSDKGTPAQTATMSATIVVAPSQLAIGASSLPSGQAGVSYTASLQASGGTPGYTWSLSSGSLPAGLSMSSAGVISGTPSTSGSYAFSLEVSDKGTPAQTASLSATIVVAPSQLVIGSSSLPSGQAGVSYTASLQASGGTPGYTWSAVNLPSGLSLSSAGVISGTPSTSGSYAFSLAVSDKGTPAQTASLSATIVVAPSQLVIGSSSLPSAQAGVSYTASLQASGGTPGYTWSAVNLPSGLSMSSAGVISGTLSASGSYTFNLAVSDEGTPAQTATMSATIMVAPSQLVVGASTLPSGQAGVSYTASLQASGGTPGYTWSLSSGSLPAGLSMSSAGVISGTPSTSGSYSFMLVVSDKGTPAQTQSAAASITLSPAVPTLVITSASLVAGTDGTAYSQVLTASGGSPAYTWSISSGSLPAGLTLAATTGQISGTPTAAGLSNFTTTVSDNSNPIQTSSIALSISIVTAPQVLSQGTTWFVRTDGGTRYSSNVPQGQCDGQSDTAYQGSGVNQHCAFNDFRYLWDDDSGAVGAGAWVIAGGDTVVIRGCHALPGQQNATDPNCRIGWDGPWGSASDNWCYGVGSYTCYNPPIPAGTAANHTRILGACAYGTYTCTPIDNSYPYGSTNETQLFGGFSLTWTFNLAGTQNVDIEGIELTTHNGQCVRGGAPAYPRWCNNNQPLDDFAQNGILTDDTTANVTLQDVYIHGFNSAGLYGPIGGAIIATRLFTGFNGFAGWNFADTSDTPDAPGSSITASYVTMIGNGCYEQYPIVNSTFPAQTCYDDLSQGFGDAWSGQDTPLDTLICDHCVQKYNTKDGFIGPHTQIKHLTITNSASIGNMGEQWKFGTDMNATVVFQNNLTVGNSYRMSAALPGAAQNFSMGSGLPGSYLSDFGRAGGDIFSIITQAGSAMQFSGNSMILASQTGIDFNCGLVNRAGSVTGGGTCGAVPIIWTDNLFVGYTDTDCASCGGLAPGLWYKSDASINYTSSYNLEVGIRNGDTCGANHILCTDPLLQNEPAQTWPGSEAAIDTYDPANPTGSFHPAPLSPLIGAGVAIDGLSLDYFGTIRPNPPTIGAVVK